MSLADVCPLPAFPVSNGRVEEDPSVNSETLPELSKDDIVRWTLDTIIANAVERGSQHVQSTVTTKILQGPTESNVAEDLEESKIQEGTSVGAEKVAKNKLKKKVKRLTRKQLEKFISEKTQELISTQSEVKKLQTNCQTLKKEVKEWKDKSDTLAKSCSNLAKLVKLNLEGNSKTGQPSKQVRSVGVQVKIAALPPSTPTKRQLEEKTESCAKKAATTLQQVTSKPQVATPKHVTTPQHITTQKHVPTQVQKHVSALQNITTQKHVAVTPIKKVSPEKKVIAEDDEISIVKQVARLPPLPRSDVTAGSPPKPNLKLTQTGAGLEVYWTYQGGYSHTLISSYELYAFQDTFKQSAVAAWKKVGEIKSIPLPIRCTLSHFKSGSTYYFVVRAKDLKGGFGNFSDVQKISLK